MDAVTRTADDLLQAPLALLDSRFPQRIVALPSGARVAVRECGVPGDAPTIVLLHGISSGAASWLHPAVMAGEQAHVIAWDAPGYGDSTPLAGDAPRDADYAARLHELLQVLDVRRCVLVGHSLGALMAAAYVRDMGASRVARVVFISPAGGYGGAAQAAASERVRTDRREALHTLGVDGLAERIAQRLLSPAADAAARAWVQWNTARLQPAGYLQAVELLCASDLGASRDLEVPVEIHCGDADVVTPPAACRGWADLYAAPFDLIKGAGHASPVEQPEAVARLITRAVRQPTGVKQHE
ncbi:alpha/beta hydrolase [Polaromonas sp. SM01]|uniref:alpha/beta fold hydrolase n=1 Tax=Polaromonas sp. SM01 TaxID=3085630 RepID=UPI0029818211|nr:alpha/beta hydrolase [Polaromonas sp. SM01]MDW5443615.1 alpha/beta hydrolase [Polaromonas sp. SM01]